jgi:hypothetical protein
MKGRMSHTGLYELIEEDPTVQKIDAIPSKLPKEKLVEAPAIVAEIEDQKNEDEKNEIEDQKNEIEDQKNEIEDQKNEDQKNENTNPNLPSQIQRRRKKKRNPN